MRPILAAGMLGHAVGLLGAIALAAVLGLVGCQAALADLTPGTAQVVSGTSAVFGVACPSDTGCLTTGYRGEGGGVVVPIGANGTPGSVQVAGSTLNLDWVACVSASSCLAVGETGTVGAAVPVAADGAPGAVQNVDGSEALSGVACPSAISCVAVGTVFPGDGMVVPVGIDGTPGTAVTVTGMGGEINAVACPTATGCLAVGTDTGADTGVVLPVTADGTPGTIQPVNGYDLEGVACMSATVCFAVGTNGSSGVVVPLAADGTPSTAVTVTGTADLKAAECSSLSCVAVGTNTAGVGVVVPIAAGGTPGTVETIAGTAILYGIGCTSATSCVAAGVACTTTKSCVAPGSTNTAGVVVPLGVNTSGGAGGGGGAVPSHTGALPAITGRAAAGHRLSCPPGNWSGDPEFAYQWSLDGTPIQGATDSTYTVQTIDEGLTLTCTVTASNAAGVGKPVTSQGVLVPVPKVRGCPAATGGLSGARLGLVRLGMTRSQARNAYTHSSNRGKKYEDFFCLTPIGVRVGYASPTELDALPKSERAKLEDRVIWASTSSAYYAVDGIRAGATVAAAKAALKLEAPFQIGLNTWYLAAGHGSTAILKVRHGIVEEIGIAASSLTSGRKRDRAFLTSFS